MSQAQHGRTAINLDELLHGRKRANAVIDAVSTIAPTDPSYEVTLKYLERRQAASRTAVDVGLASTAILLALAALFNKEAVWAFSFLVVAVLMVGLTLWASLNAGGDEHRITKLQIAAAAGQTAPSVPQPRNPFVALMRTLGF